MAAIVGAAGLLPTLAAIAQVKPFCWPIKNHWLPADVFYGRRKAEQSAIVTGR